MVEHCGPVDKGAAQRRSSWKNYLAWLGLAENNLKFARTELESLQVQK